MVWVCCCLLCFSHSFQNSHLSVLTITRLRVGTRSTDRPRLPSHTSAYKLFTLCFEEDDPSAFSPSPNTFRGQDTLTIQNICPVLSSLHRGRGWAAARNLFTQFCCSWIHYIKIHNGLPAACYIQMEPRMLRSTQWRLLDEDTQLKLLWGRGRFLASLITA